MKNFFKETNFYSKKYFFSIKNGIFRILEKIYVLDFLKNKLKTQVNKSKPPSEVISPLQKKVLTESFFKDLNLILFFCIPYTHKAGFIYFKNKLSIIYE